MSSLLEVVTPARGGDAGAVEALVEATYADVWRLCAALVDRQAADDLTQETFTRALRSLSGFRGDASVQTWILAIARRTCADELRSRTRRRRRDGRLAVHAAADAADAARAPDPASDVVAWQLLARLDPDRRAAFALTQLFRLSYEEAATVCDCPPGTIRSRVARARADLIDLLDAGATAAQLSSG